MLADLFHAENACGTATVGSSEVPPIINPLFKSAPAGLPECLCSTQYPMPTSKGLEIKGSLGRG